MAIPIGERMTVQGDCAPIAQAFGEILLASIADLNRQGICPNRIRMSSTTWNTICMAHAANLKKEVLGLRVVIDEAAPRNQCFIDFWGEAA